MSPADEVFALRRRYWQHGYRPLEVLNPDQRVNDNGEPLKSPGKQPRGRWRIAASHDPPEAAHAHPDPRALNTGLLCDDIVAFDVDVLNQELADQIITLIERELGQTPLVRIGRAPKALLVYQSERRFKKIQTQELFFPNGSKAKVELLAEGQQFVADGIHPETRQPYRWTDGTPADVPLQELPKVSEQKAREIIAAAERLLRVAGGRERERPQHDSKPRRNGGGSDFFLQVNTLALDNIADWADSLFPRARFEPGTGAWRVSSKDLGRDLEEDISIHPDGIQDFGEERGLSAVDLVLHYAPKVSTSLEAALWLCERLKIEPESLGFRKNQDNKTYADDDDKSKPPLWHDRPLSDWANREIPPRQWIMEDWIPVGQCVGLYGVGGVRKTDWLLQLLMAASLCLPFCGISLMHCKTYGLFCEDSAEEIVRRAQRIASFYGRDLSEFTGFNFASLVGVDDTEFVQFDTGQMIKQAAYHLFEQRIREHQANLAVLDTAPDFFGGEEINRRQVSRFFRALDTIGIKNDCAIVFSAHPSQRGRQSGRFDSGSTGWEGKVRARLVLRDPIEEEADNSGNASRIFRPPSDKRILTRAKSNYARPGEEIDLVIRDGAFAPQTEAGDRGTMRNIACEQKFLELLRKLKEQGRYVHDAKNVPDRYAPNVFASHPGHDFVKGEFTRAMIRLLDRGRIKLVPVGSAHRGHKEFVEVK